MYQSCIFDLYGTLVDIHTDEDRIEVWEKLVLFFGYYGAGYTAKELRLGYNRIVEEMLNGKKELRNCGHEAYPEISIEKVFLKLFQEKQVDADRAIAIYTGQFFRALSTDFIRLYKGTKEMLAQLVKEGKQLYLLSNAQRIFAEYEMKALGIFSYFDGILISSDFPYKKPDSRFFEQLIERYNISKDTAIMIGNDAVCDILGAKKAGLHTFYIHSNLSPNEAFPKADYVLEQMDMCKIGKILSGE